jgi:hypothetical protein
MKLEKTPQGYTYLPVLPFHIYNWGGRGVCDSCNQDLTHGGYLVFILKRCICSDCFNEWVDRATVDPEDLACQEKEQSYWYAERGFIIK